MKCTQRKEPERNKNRELATRQPQEAFSPAVEPEKYQEQECWFHQNLIIQVLRKFQFKVIKGYYNLFHDLIRLIFIGMLCIDVTAQQFIFDTTTDASSESHRYCKCPNMSSWCA